METGYNQWTPLTGSRGHSYAPYFATLLTRIFRGQIHCLLKFTGALLAMESQNSGRTEIWMGQMNRWQNAETFFANILIKIHLFVKESLARWSFVELLRIELSCCTRSSSCFKSRFSSTTA